MYQPSQRSPDKLTISFGDKTETFEEVDFCKYYKFGINPNLWCGKLEPSLKWKNENVQYIRFFNFTFDNGILTFLVPNIVSLQIKKDIKITIITPIPNLDPIKLYPKCENDSEIIYAEVFYKTNKRSIPFEYVGTVSGKFTDLAQAIEDLMIQTDRGKFNIKVTIGAIGDAEKPLKTTFASYKEGTFRRVITVFLRSNKNVALSFGNRLLSLENVPSVPKNIISSVLAIPNLEAEPDKFQAQIYRRIMLICYNCGIPTHLFDALKNKMFTSDQFDRSNVRFDDLEQYEADLAALKYPLANLKSQIYTDTSESTLRSLLWDVIIGQLLCDISTDSNTLSIEQGKQEFKIASEWQLNTLFKDAEQRIVDLVVLSELNGTEFPILLVEIGKEDFKSNLGHKDFSKLLEMMSMCCVQLATKLIKGKRLGKLARVYGIWIGGLSVQLCVAHPVIKLTANDKHEIHTNLSFFPEWKMNLSINTQENPEATVTEEIKVPKVSESTEVIGVTEDTEMAAATEASTSAETSTPNIEEGEEIKARNGNPSSPKSPKLDVDIAQVQVNTNEFDFFEPRRRALQFSDSTTLEPLKDHTIKLDEKEELFPIMTPELIASVKAGNFNPETLAKLKRFLECVKQRIALIRDSVADETIVEKDFELPPEPVFSSSVKDLTPANLQTKVLPQAHLKPVQRNLKQEFKNTKVSITELELHRLFQVSEFFPKMYKFSVDPVDGVITYSFEKMRPLMLSHSDINHSLFFNEDILEMIVYECVRFAMHCLHQLYLMHSVFGVVHSDISPWNILFSPLAGVWKLNDFDQSLQKEISSKTSRRAGTEGYIAPESLETGIFTVESDVFSLGQVIVNCVYPVVLSQVSDIESFRTEDPELLAWIDGLEDSISAFEKLFKRMIRKNPEERPSVLDALKAVYEVSLGFDFKGKQDSTLEIIKFIVEHSHYTEAFISNLKILQIPQQTETESDSEAEAQMLKKMEIEEQMEKAQSQTESQKPTETPLKTTPAAAATEAKEPTYQSLQELIQRQSKMK